MFKPADNGPKHEYPVYDYKGAGVGLAMYNTDAYIHYFAQSSFKFALDRKINLFFSKKNNILKRYDGRFKDIFEEVYEKKYKKEFERAGIWYEHRLIDDMAGQMLKSKGGSIIAMKYYDGDVQSDIVAQ